MTLVEAIKQIVNTHSSCNILACAPSNSAADHLCEKMLEKAIDEKKVYRFYALSCTVRNIPKMKKVWIQFFFSLIFLPSFSKISTQGH